MEIYVYGLILAGYLVLWFVSRDGEGTGIGRMAEFLYRKGKAAWRRFGWKRTFEEDTVRRDLMLLYPYGRLEGEEKKFCVERIRLVLLIILAGDILAAAGYAAAGADLLLKDGGLVREQIGGEDRSTELDAYIVQEDPDPAAGDDVERSLTYQGSYRLEVRSKKFSEEQILSMAEEVFTLLPARILGENESLEHVTAQLDLPEMIEGYPFAIHWESSSYALLDADGKIENSALGEEEGREVILTAVLLYDNGTTDGFRKSREYEVKVYGPSLSQEERLSREIRDAIESADERSASENTLPLPAKLDDRTLFWEEKPPGSGMALLLFAAITAFLASAAMGSRLHEKVKERERQMQMDYPQIISKFVLFLGAGLSVRSTFIKIGEDYTKRREQGMPERGAYEEILLVCRELASGVPETEAYANFGQRCRSRQYTRLSALLTQNLKKGNQELLSVMRQEAKASYEERQNTARKLGEEAETKLLLPMILMLAITMLIIIIPAYYSFAA